MPDTPQMGELEQTNAAAPQVVVADEKKAESADEPQPKTYGAFKGYFFTPKRGDVRGAFCVIFEGSTGDLLENLFWVTRSDEKALDVSMRWREFNKMIPELGPYDKTLGERLFSSMLEVFSAARRAEVFQQSDSSILLSSVNRELLNSFERLTHYFLKFDSALERVSRKDLIEAGFLPSDAPLDEPSAEGENQEEGKTFTGLLITCLPVIDPIRGIPVSELRPGDLIEVKIQGGPGGASGLLQQFLSSTNQDPVFPVESVEKKEDDKTYVFLDINEEIKGLLTLSKDLRLRTLQRGVPKTPTVNTDTLLFLGILGVSFLIVLLVAKYLFF